MTCWRLRRVLTRYADDELTTVERDDVDRHLETCEACRHRVRVEQAVRQSLLNRTARAGSAAWLARPEFPSQPSTTGWYARRAAVIAGLMIVLVFGSSRWFGATAVEAVGVISDSHCNGVHRPVEAPNVDPPDCIQGCLKKGARLVFVAGDKIYNIRNQDFTDLLTQAGRPVQVIGTAQGTELTVAHLDGAR
jgi:hypothetical protein